MSYNIRANEDKNLFIVDDYYDKDTDILAYASSLVDGIKIWNNEFTSVKEKINQTAKLLNLEVFCDTQGHIRVRSPQYNRMPSSVFYRMMYLKQTLNIQVFPEYLNDLFTDQLESLKTQIEISEDEIRIDCDVLSTVYGLSGLLNSGSDGLALSFINDGISNNTGATSNTGAAFNFISDRASGKVIDINSLIQQANPDVVQSQLSTSLNGFNAIKNQSGLKQVFDNSQRFIVINKAINVQQLNQSGYNANNTSISNNTDINNLISRVESKSGQKFPPLDFIQTNAINIKFVQLPVNSTIDIFKVTSDLQTKISQRQQLLKLFYAAIKNAAELKSLDTSKGVSSQLITPGGFGNSHIPEVFEHMIEDETYDDYGIGSGSRYIIKRSQIIRIDIAANPPPYTTVEVQGILSQFLSNPGNLPSDLNFFPGSGNGMVTAFAVDYDMWRTYGFKGNSTVQVPFLSDPISQCGPYAAMLLSVARKNIFRGSITIAGNEYMQPGEVVFLEDRGMLFYVTSVRHSLTLASGFSTELELTYGHTPGEYIPTPMDFIGKLIYKNKHNGDITVQRQDNSGNEINIGALTLPPNFTSSSNSTGDALNTGGANQTPNSTSEFNKQVMTNILFMAAPIINNNSTDNNNVQTTIEIRIYSNSDQPASSNLDDFAAQVEQQIIGLATGPKDIPSTPTGVTNNSISASVTSVSVVNLSNVDDRRSPSQKAMDLARNQVASSAGNVTGANASQYVQALRQILFNYIVDIWIVKTPIPSKTQTSNGS